MLELILLAGLGAVAGSNAAENGESKEEKKKAMDDTQLDGLLHRYSYPPLSRAGKSEFPSLPDADSAISTIAGGLFIGRTIKTTRNSLTVFKDCEFINCKLYL